MYLLIDHNDKVVKDYDGDKHVFNTESDAQDFADNRDEPDWMIVKFVAFT